MLVDVDDNRVIAIRGDRNNPVSRGFTCPKGRFAGQMMHHTGRLRTSLVRDRNGAFKPVAPTQAAKHIGDTLTALMARHGPDCIAMFLGTQGIFATLTNPVARSWFAATGSRKLFSTMTIDQSAKWVTAGRMGEYLGGRHGLSDADVWMLVGTNPLISVNGGAGDGVLMQTPSASLAAARNRGLKLIVIDPRRTETASRADLHLAPKPGHDALIFAGLINIILTEGLHDAGFCRDFAKGLGDLHAAVRGVTPQQVADRSGLSPHELIEAARLFARGPRGSVSTGTGVCMGPHSNLTEHLAMALNVICGRFLREGEVAPATAVLGPLAVPRAQVAPPSRSWQSGYTSRLGAGLIRGEMPTNLLTDEILQSGSDRVRALIVSGGNPALALPDAAKALKALTALELLVVIDPYLSETARLADYVIAPTMAYERADHSIHLEKYFPFPYAIQAEPLVAPPPGVIEDWQFFWQLARSMDVPLPLGGAPIDMQTMPSSRDLLAQLAQNGRVAPDQLAAAPHGLCPPDRLIHVAPALDDAQHHRLDLLPSDVASELQAMLASHDHGHTMRLIVRRMREVMNSVGREVDGLPRQPYNPASMNPGDMKRLGLCEGKRARITSVHGPIEVIVKSDSSIRPGTVSVSHGWSSGSDGHSMSANVNALTGNDDAMQAINHMPQLTSLPVEIAPLP